MKRLALVIVVLSAALIEPAQARYLPASTGYRAIWLDAQQAEREVPWTGQTEFGRCGRPVLGRYECQVSLEGREMVEYDPDIGIIYRAHFCSWVGVAKWRFRRVVVVRRELGCEHWWESSRGAVWE